ncbi:glucokinase [Roseinatronobacter alkalisoli]|uniref:Glucokinase n=1 Tax=Roseinatronobacter alkalisoli TaxID=3028235 RepID=A0ABT5T446_9RHOB|nr:glucokinase [Roseinatronobacter sp. HJB301]MDD7969893.1 glucokinase [Roseinatronobacter sp. HJB301]
MTAQHSTTSAPLVLVADIGGTNTRMAFARGHGLVASSTKRFRNAEFAGLGDIVARFLSQHAEKPEKAAFALAGLVHGDDADMTNLGWKANARDIARDNGIAKVHFLNDLQAQGHAVAGLPESHLRTIRPGQPEGATRLVIGLGTGVNAAPVFPTSTGQTIVPASESGHIHLPLHGQDDYDLADWLIARRGIASVEDVLAGAGLERLYSFHAEQAGLAGGKDAAAILAAMETGCTLAQSTGRHYVRLLGQTAASLALVTLPYAGIYLIGGVARAFAPWLDQFGFESAFTDMGRMSPLVQRIPVSLVEDDYAALAGCAAYIASR